MWTLKLENGIYKSILKIKYVFYFNILQTFNKIGIQWYFNRFYLRYNVFEYKGDWLLLHNIKLKVRSNYLVCWTTENKRNNLVSNKIEEKNH